MDKQIIKLYLNKNVKIIYIGQELEYKVLFCKILLVTDTSVNVEYLRGNPTQKAIEIKSIKTITELRDKINGNKTY